MPAKRYGETAQKKVAKTMREFKRGTLKSGQSGKKVTSRKQVIAIGLSQARHYVATPFSGNGMTYAGIAALLLRDVVTGASSPWTKLYKPKRLPTLPQLARKGLDYGEEFIKGVGRIITS